METMKLNPPKNITFWAAVIIAAIGVVGYALHIFAFNSVPYLGGVFFLLLLVAFVLLCLGLTMKGL
jgi:hypothetical protein